MSSTNKDLKEEVQEVLSQNQEKISFEELPNQESSPLNQAVVDKDNFGTEDLVAEFVASDNNLEDAASRDEIEIENESHLNANTNATDTTPHKLPKDDAPEQEINENYSETVIEEEESFELPLSHAKQAADTVLGVANNVIEVGGGYFVKIRKHKEFYEFEEIISVVEKQNEKNIQRIKLDKEDQILLRPLLIQVLKTKAQKLTPEQQLIAAILSIGMKKAQVVMEVRNENEILVERILDIVRAEKEEKEEVEEAQEKTKNEEQEQGIVNTDTQDVVGMVDEIAHASTRKSEIVSDTIDQQVLVVPPLNSTVNPLINIEQVMEIAVDDVPPTATPT